MHWLQWSIVLSLCSFILSATAVAEEEPLSYMAKVKALDAKVSAAAELTSTIRQIPLMEELNRKEMQALQDLKPGLRQRGESQNTSTQTFNSGQRNANYNPYHDYLERAEAFQADPKNNSVHKGEYHYAEDGTVSKKNSSKDIIARSIGDEAEKKKFLSWAEKADSAVEQKSKIATAKQESNNFKTALAAFENNKSMPMTQDQYNQMSKQLSQMGLPEEKYNAAVKALEKVKEATPTIKVAYPHGQKGIDPFCMMKRL